MSFFAILYSFALVGPILSVVICLPNAKGLLVAVSIYALFGVGRVPLPLSGVQMLQRAPRFASQEED